jgi:hypothetical protein
MLLGSIQCMHLLLFREKRELLRALWPIEQMIGMIKVFVSSIYDFFFF